MKRSSGQWFEQEPTESEMEHKTLGDEPTYVKALNYVPNPPNYNTEFTNITKLPGKSLREYYRRKK